MCCQAFRSANAAGQQHQKGGVVTLLALGLLGTIGPPMPAYAMEETLALEEVVVTARRREGKPSDGACCGFGTHG